MDLIRRELLFPVKKKKNQNSCFSQRSSQGTIERNSSALGEVKSALDELKKTKQTPVMKIHKTISNFLLQQAQWIA